MELLILLIATAKYIIPIISAVAVITFAIYAIKNRHDTYKTKRASQILFYVTGSLYYLSRVLKLPKNKY